jgi:hypothetical protein
MTNSTRLPPRNNETVRDGLNHARDTTRLTWEQISEILGVPAGTLWDVANGKPVPRKWRAKLGLRRVKDLYSMPVKELRWAIKNRIEI